MHTLFFVLVHQYHSVLDIYNALVNHEVSGALIDTYVAAAKSQMFTDAGKTYKP